MPVDQFVGEAIKHVINRKLALVACHLGVEQDLQQQVAKLAGQLLPVAIVDRLQNLICFLDRLWFDGVEGLLAVPRAAVRTAKTGHDCDRALETLTSSRHGWH